MRSPYNAKHFKSAPTSGPRHMAPAKAPAPKRKGLKSLSAAFLVMALSLAAFSISDAAEAARPPCKPKKLCQPTTTTTVPSTTSTTGGTTSTSTTTTSTTTTTTTVPPTTTTTVPPTGATPLWHGNADTDVDRGGNTDCMDKETPGLSSDHLSIANDPNGQYGKVYKAYLTAADINAGNNRAEWNEAYRNCDGNNELNLWGENGPSSTDVFVGWRSMFGGNYFLSGADNDGNVLQWKGDSSCGGPAVGMTIRNNRLAIRTIDGDFQAYSGPLFSSLVDGEWHDMVLRVNFSKTSTGFVEFWLDGVAQTMLNGQTRINVPTVCPNDVKVYPKWGTYGMDVGTGAGPIHYLESPRIGLSYAQAVPR